MGSDEKTRSTLTLRARWQRYWYLQHVALWLDPMPHKRRKPVLRELKANLDAAAGEDGMAAAIDDLGRPRVLARQYLETEPRRGPTWHHGVVAVGAALLVWFYILLGYVLGSIDTLLDIDRTEPAEISFLGISIITEAHDARLSATFSGFSWISLITFLVIFLLFSRIWRLVRRTRKTDDDAAHLA